MHYAKSHKSWHNMQLYFEPTQLIALTFEHNNMKKNEIKQKKKKKETNYCAFHKHANSKVQKPPSQSRFSLPSTIITITKSFIRFIFHIYKILQRKMEIIWD